MKTKVTNPTIQAIRTIIENSSEFTCGNITFKQNEFNITLWDTKHEEFYSTSIVVKLSSFDTYLKFDEKLNKVILVVW